MLSHKEEDVVEKTSLLTSSSLTDSVAMLLCEMGTT